MLLLTVSIHIGLLKNDCECEPPLQQLFMFPSIKRNFEKREAWVKLLKRVKDNDMVCSEHFVDGILTFEIPNPILKLGYELKERHPKGTLESL